MLYLFDLDNTLISSYMETAGRVYDRWHPLTGRRERLQMLLAEGHAIAIVSNQGGVAFGLVTFQQMQRKLKAAVKRLGLPPDTPIYVACHDARGKPPYNDPSEAKRRKPAGLMLREAIADQPDAAADGVLMVGDQPSDRAAARDANVRFMWAKDFFALAS